MSGQEKRLMAMAGETDGHTPPGLAIAYHLVVQGWRVCWLGTADHMETGLVLKRGIEIDFIRISGLYERGVKVLVAAPLRILNAWRQTRAITKTYKPDVMLGVGGYVSGSGGLVAQSLGIPVVFHKQNGIADLTNKWLAKIATKVMQASPDTFPSAEVVDNPICTGALALSLPQQRLVGREGPVHALVVDGPQGARILNQTALQAAMKLGDSVIIWHQNGKGSRQSVERAYVEAGQPQHKVTEFTDDMTTACTWAGVVVCRSGALMVSEIAAVGLPTSFMPSQHKNRQQYWNALLLEKAGTAEIIEQPQLSADAVTNTLAGWSQEILLTMAEHTRAASVSDVTERVANEVSRTARA